MVMKAKAYAAFAVDYLNIPLFKTSEQLLEGMDATSVNVSNSCKNVNS